VGAAVQYQKDFTGASGNTGVKDDVTEFNADLLAEYNTKGSGTVRLEGAYYHFDTDAMPVDNHFFVSLGYLTPENIGIGKLNPIVRFQQATNSDSDAKVRMIDAMVAYVMKDYFAKLMLVYTNTDWEADDPETGATVEGKSNALQLAFQIQQ
jgi:hypothetical protein